MDRSGKRPKRFVPGADVCESRILLSTGVLHQPGGADHPVRPNTPVLPYGVPTRAATFLDPSSRIVDGLRISFGSQTYVAPYAGLDATAGYLKVGSSSTLLDNSELVANPGRVPETLGVEVGDQTVISYGARVEGMSRIGAYAADAQPTEVGPNATVINSVIEPGAIVGTGATVSHVTIPTGVKVLPGVTITNQAEASDPSLKKVVPVTAADRTAVLNTLHNTKALAAGYTTLYQGQSRTGVAGSPVANTTLPNLFNGDLSRVRGVSPEPATAPVNRRVRPRFLANHGKTIGVEFPEFPARITGAVIFRQKAAQVQHRLGRMVAIRADEGQPIRIASIRRLDSGVSIHAEKGTSLTIGRAFRAGTSALILGGKGSIIGSGVDVGRSAVIQRSTLGNNVVVGDGAIVIDSTLPDGTVVAPGSVIVKGQKI